MRKEQSLCVIMLQLGEMCWPSLSHHLTRELGDFGPNLLKVVFSPHFQVLQQELVDVESLDDVDCCGKALLDRLTMPVIFPDGYVHKHTSRFIFNKSAS